MNESHDLLTKVCVTNIQRFSLHDGPGIRTTIFFKGCSLHCPWCANPENISFDIEMYKDNNNVYTFGQLISLQDLFSEITKDKIYYINDGGVTFSGGEPLLIFDKLEPLLEKLKNNNINICTETSLFVPSKMITIAAKYLSYIIVDLKIFDSQKCKEILGGNLELYFRNLDYLNDLGIDKTLRIPLISPYVTNEDNLKLIIQKLKALNFSKIELIKGHNLAEEKYKKLEKQQYNVPELTEENIKMIESFFNEKKIKPIICSI